MTTSLQYKQLSELVYFYRGLTYSKKDEVNFSTNIVLRSNNVDLNTNKIDLNELRYINPGIEIPSNKMLQKNSILICMANGSKSHLGKVALVEQELNYAFGGFMGMIVAKNQLIPKYLFYILTSPSYKSFISSLSDGANINNLRFDDLGKFQIPVPPLKEQERIVALLDEALAAIDKAIDNIETNLQNVQELTISYLNTSLENTQANWTEGYLEELVADYCTLSYGIVQPGNDYPNGLPVVRPTDLSKSVIDVNGLKRIDPKLSNGYQRTKLKGDDILLCVRGTTGLLSIASNELKDANVTRGIVPINFDKQKVQQQFGYYALKSMYVQNQIKNKTYGTALMQINISDLRKLKVQYTKSLSQQTATIKKLDTFFEKANELTSLYKTKLEHTTHLRKALFEKAFAGHF